MYLDAVPAWHSEIAGQSEIRLTASREADSESPDRRTLALAPSQAMAAPAFGRRRTVIPSSGTLRRLAALQRQPDFGCWR